MLLKDKYTPKCLDDYIIHKHLSQKIKNITSEGVINTII